MWFYANDGNSLAVSSQRGHKSEGKINICKPSKELARTRKDYVIGRDILNYVTRVTSLLALYSREKTIKFNREF